MKTFKLTHRIYSFAHKRGMALACSEHKVRCKDNCLFVVVVFLGGGYGVFFNLNCNRLIINNYINDMNII